ncbi:AP-5 complex subunit mu-1 isoform X1 [Bufo bufo]|uniref:AP-5 complex subunit mu-1 isoform X1 n=1 Tax=Bufo bufo TaxID=8384 RepID=UPI001ABEAFE6|nr:AP-5 complex subunit mu-1 isoform X1 [Bufo bufo]XP_040266828.1 AP-5 complex subunit mu-1 isoform X1 [Bufo bufo]XP_040266829.1 AP-5 complex subunit mu-1 isoform X1 [Bufo bufo]
MPIRGLWIFYHRPGGRGEVKFSRHYPTVEKRAKAFNRASYVNVPEDVDLLKALLHELGLTNEEKNFVEYRDNCARISKTNVYSLVVSEGNLWPVLAIQSGDFIYVCLPLVEQLLTPVPPLINVSSISEAFSLLSGIMQFVNSGHNAEADVSSRLTQLPLLVTQACPLGSPLDTDFFALPDNLSNASANQSYKSPAWKTTKQKGKAQIEVYITEKVDSTQYDKGDDSDTWQVHGTVSCKCNLETISPNVIVGLNLPANGSPLQDILVHPCVTSIDSSMLISSSVAATDDSAFNGPYKFPFIPPFDLFQLCYYTSQVPVPPILGFYQLTDDGHQVQISVKLKLHESIKNGFDYCEAQIPFFNKGQIKHFEYKVSHGHLELSREKSLVVWVIGQKFPKSLEISLSGTVTFLSEKHLNDPVDPICVGNTAYVKLLFRIPDYSLTGCYTDQHSVQVFSTAKPKILTSRELISADYFLWNSKAPAPIVCRSFFD